ncbi:unnamed protein product [Musa textilis]
MSGDGFVCRGGLPTIVQLTIDASSPFNRTLLEWSCVRCLFHLSSSLGNWLCLTCLSTSHVLYG